MSIHLFKKILYLFICQREITQAEGEAGRGRSSLLALEGAPGGTQSQDPR